ncbi:MAG: hypothetical protein ACOYL9_02645 [Ilumatobacteraceae bacterium]
MTDDNPGWVLNDQASAEITPREEFAPVEEVIQRKSGLNERIKTKTLEMLLDAVQQGSSHARLPDRDLDP